MISEEWDFRSGPRGFDAPLIRPRRHPETSKGRHTATLSKTTAERWFVGAGDEIRTHDPNLGKVMLYP